VCAALKGVVKHPLIKSYLPKLNNIKHQIHVVLTSYNKYKEHCKSPLRHRKVYVRVKPNIPAIQREEKQSTTVPII